MSATVKRTVTAKGHLTLGKRFAGQDVLIEETEPGVWIIRTAAPEAWLHTPKAAADLKSALAWAAINPVSDGEAAATLARLNDHVAEG
jgi:hypothetical protein